MIERRIQSRLLFALFLLPLWAHAEVTAVGDGGFTVQHEITVGKDADAVYDAMTKIGQWWNPAHSWSGDPDNLYFDARPGGCFCERLPNGGGVEHLRIIYLAPGSRIHFDGALGPLQGMSASGRMIWMIKSGEGGTHISFTYHVMGFLEGGFEGLAPAVDGVIGEQLTRLGAYISTPAE